MPPVPATASPRPDRALVAAFVVLYALLDWASFIRPLHGLNITPWNPQGALAIALLMREPRALPWVGAAIVGADLAVRGWPSDWPATVAATLALALAYAAVARVLVVRLAGRFALDTRSDLLWTTAVVVAGALLAALAYVSTWWAAGAGPGGSIAEAVVRYWIGDAVGILVTLPALLMLGDARRRAELSAAVLDPRALPIGAATLAVLWFVFGRDDPGSVRFAYLLLLPVVWASAALGAAGAVCAAAATQVGLIAGVQVAANPDLTVFELQVLVATVTMTGLMLGVVVDERRRADAALRGSLRLAAAGQMAAALAHELTQPLTALGSHARSCTVLASRVREGRPADAEALADVLRRIDADARRASEVVKRLRDFFRTGSTQLRPVAPAALVDEALAAHLRRAQVLGLALHARVGDALPAVPMDAVQISVVLRNLIDNAIDAAAAAPPPARVEVSVEADGRWLHVAVTDTGAGVAAARLSTLFDAGPSDKPGGMGVGLSICRAIVEGHGGRLWADPGPGGRLHFTLPLTDAAAGASDAP